jgi:bzd-type benzoyl-CoA reductase Q subunit
VLEKSGMKLEDVTYVIGTGYGRVNVPFAHKAITEIACHARGANYMGGNTVRTILDMGGQDCKAIHCDEKGKVTNFLMNDKCAAGTGRGMEVIADLMQIPIAELGPRSFEVDEEPEAVSSTCVVFAKSEALGLLKAGYSKNKVIAAYCQAMAERVVSLIERIGVENDFFITGGIAKNPGVVKRIEKLLGTKAVETKLDSQIAGALGAALFGYTLMQKQGASAKPPEGGSQWSRSSGPQSTPLPLSGPEPRDSRYRKGERHDRELRLQGRLGRVLHQHRHGQVHELHGRDAPA